MTRDFIGYGRTIPHARWPRDARIAVQFVMNYEEGGENCILHGDRASEAFLSEIIGAQPWPGQRHMSMESIYEFGSRSGFWRLWRLFKSRSLPLTVFAVANAMVSNPEAVAAMKEADWEIACHGLKWIDYKDFTEAEERDHVSEAIRIHTECVGKRPLGFYQGRTSSHTLDVVMEEQGFLYSADSYADELPYWLEGPHGPQLLVPYTLDVNDMRFATAQGFNSGDQFFTYLKDSFDTLYAEGAERPRMLSVGLHCRLAGRPGRTSSLARFLDHISRQEGVWITTRLDIARHWIRHHPPAGGYRPSRLPRALFMERFGGIFEHSPSVAARTHQAGISAANDTPSGLHEAFMRTIATLGRDETIALIKQHPELSGCEAIKGTLTDASVGEQNRLGFLTLTPDEHSRVSEVNRRYRDKFGFPLVVALTLHSERSTVVAEMNKRLTNDPETEIINALDQIGHIALGRLKRAFEH